MNDYKLTASEWYIKLHTQNANQDLHKEFKEWLAADPENELAYIECEIALSALNHLEKAPEVQSIIESIETEHPETAFNFSKIWGKFSQKSTLRYTTAITGLVCICLLSMNLLNFYSKPPTNNQIYSTLPGKQKTIALNDGSIVNLNTGSQLHINYEEKRRQLALKKGEAVFTVEHDPTRPFDVIAGNRIVRAIGTRFNIIIDGDNIIVSVLEGKVKVLNQTTLRKNTIDIEKNITPGFSASYNINDDSVITITKSEKTERISGWLQGQLTFNNWMLADAIKEHNRYADIKIFFKDKRINAMRIAGVFKIGDTESFLSALKATFPIEIDRTENIIWLKYKSS